MKSLGQKYEKALSLAGRRAIGGIDEAGRGPWAGPVVAACLICDLSVKPEFKVNDSKKMPAKAREECYEWLKENFIFGVGIVSHEVIDGIGILNATRQAMKEAISALTQTPDYLLIDAVRLRDIKTPQENIIHGDAKVWSIAAASIVAKVTRDRLMREYHEKYPEYGFDRHKGYGTKLHQEMLKRHGICEIHRRSFRPIACLVTQNS